MLKRLSLSLILICALAAQSFGDDKLYEKLQEVSVTVKAGFSEGSGVIITREVTIAPNKVEKINFVWTAGHVIDGLRSVRTIITNGQPRKIVEFKDAQVVKELIEDGRRVGEIKMDAKVIKYSDSEDGEDLALLMIRKRSFITTNSEFHSGPTPVPIGTELYHVGSLLGQVGSNSMTRGIMSSIGRVLNLGSSGGVVFDQTTVTAFPGSSGGGVFLSERSGDKAGQYVGMLVRGAGETFNLIVPVRRMKTWAKSENIDWAIDTNVPMPSLEDILTLSPEGSASKTTTSGKKSSVDSVRFPIFPTKIIPLRIVPE